MATESTKTQTKAQTKSTSAAKVEKEPAAAPVKKQTAKKVDPNTMVSVRNGFQGMLVYVSPHTHETFIWNHFGDDQEMEISELKKYLAERGIPVRRTDL